MKTARWRSPRNEPATSSGGPNLEALKWLCVAANTGRAKAQWKLGHLRCSRGVKDGYDIEENNRVAYSRARKGETMMVYIAMLQAFIVWPSQTSAADGEPGNRKTQRAQS